MSLFEEDSNMEKRARSLTRLVASATLAQDFHAPQPSPIQDLLPSVAPPHRHHVQVHPHRAEQDSLLRARGAPPLRALRVNSDDAVVPFELCGRWAVRQDPVDPGAVGPRILLGAD